MNLVVGVVVVLVSGYLPALLLTRSRVLAGLMAGAVSVVTGGLTGIACVILQVPVIPCAVVVIVAVNAVSIVLLRRRSWSDDGGTGSVIGTDAVRGSGAVGLLLFGLTALVLGFRPPEPMAWDARSIWWFRASWFEAGGDTVVDSIRNPILAFSHPDYPAGVPTLIGTVWAVLDGENLRLGMAITVVLTATAVAMLVTTVLDAARVDSPSIFLPIILVAAIVMSGEGLAAAGYLDVLGGCFIALAFVGFVRGRGSTSLLLAATALAAASLTKAEGLYFAVMLSALAAVWVAHRWRFAVVVASSLIPAVVWFTSIRAINPDLATDVRISGFVRLAMFDSGRWARLWDALPGVWDELWPFLIVAVVTTVGLGLRVGAQASEQLRLARACLAAALVTSGGVVAVYAAGDPEVGWWLDTSLDRVAVTPKLLCLLTVALCVDALAAGAGDITGRSGVHPRTQPELIGDDAG